MIYFLKTAGHYLTEKSILASATERCGLDGFPSGFRAAADCIVLNTHTPAPRSLSGVLKIADKHNIFNRSRRLGRGIAQVEKILSIGEMKGGGGSGRGSCP